MRIACSLVSSLLVILICPGVLAHAGSGGSAKFDQTHSVLDSLLSTHVRDGLVDYKGLQEHRGELQEYLESLGRVEEAAFDRFSRDEQLALLLNAYNAFTLELILRHYPVASIQDIPGNWTDSQWLLVGRKYSLNDLENDLIRPLFRDPRVHFVLVCAARGCPPLRAEAYQADRLENQLGDAARDFTRNRRFNRLETASATLFVSKIFEWYREDFTRSWGGAQLPVGSDTSTAHRAVVGFFHDYLGGEEAAFLDSVAVRISYLDYDWNLNGWDSE